MGQALYRKYRSKSLDEVVGQEHVTTTLANALKNGRISHAYLLCGPRGTGKTSIARILAHAVNDLPYTDEAPLDIIEIDAASNNGVDEIRELRDRANVAPAHAKYKVYIIDEVHMLSKGAFNALLKTLEEPPAHVIFILATTEAHKLPETIVSRTQRYTLRPVPQDQVVAHLKTIAKGEKIAIDDDALELIAKHGEGSFRDSISLLDQASSGSEHVTRTDVERILGLAPDEYIQQLVTAITSNDHTTIVRTLSELHTQGYVPAMIAQQLSSTIRDSMLSGQSTDPGTNLRLLEKLLDIPSARNPRHLLEIVLLQVAMPPTATTTPVPAIAAAPQSQAIRPTEPAAPASTVAPAPEPEPTPAAEALTLVEAAPQSAPVAANTDVAELWQQALDAIKKQYNTLYGIARMAQPTFDGQRLTLTFKFAFHQKRLNEAKNRKLIADVVQQLYGEPIEITYAVAETAEPAKKADVSAISNIFGGAELLES